MIERCYHLHVPVLKLGIAIALYIQLPLLSLSARLRLTIENCIIELNVVMDVHKICDGRTCVISDSINTILSKARHCRTKQDLLTYM